MARNHDGPYGLSDEWRRNAAYHRTDFEVAKSICSDITQLDQFKPDTDILRSFGLDTSRQLQILDFGAGMLRNTVGLLDMSPNWAVMAHDSEVMLARGQKLFWKQLNHPRNRFRWVLEPSYTKVSVNYRSFDAIVCIYVLQHLDPDVLAKFLEDSRKMTKTLCVYGRRALDDLENRPKNWTDAWGIIYQQWEPAWFFDKAGQPTVDRYSGEATDHFGAVLKPR